MTKDCIVCGSSFTRKPGRSQAQWDNQTCCSRRCANTAKARRQERLAFGQSISQQRRAVERWEAERRREERAELKRPAYVGITCRVSARPKPRQFVCGTCADCGQPFTVAKGLWHGATRCSDCTRDYWRGNHRQRARRYGVGYQHVDLQRIFERDGWRCQLCRCKVQPWSGAPTPATATIDHIVPLSRGGPHIEANLQCACWTCNSRKGARSANDQLRLAA